MADIKHVPTSSSPTEGDGVNYAGIGWFIVILTGTTIFCQVLVWGGFELMERYHVDAGRAPLSQPGATPTIGADADAGRLLTGLERPPQPAMIVDEPSVLAEFRKREDAGLTSYGWINQPLGVVRIPVDRAKALMLERGYPVRGAAAQPGARPASAPVAAQPTEKKPAAGH